MHDCLIHPCPICAIEGSLAFSTDKRWAGDARELEKTVAQLKLLRRDWGLDAEEAPPYIPPTASDYLSY